MNSISLVQQELKDNFQETIINNDDLIKKDLNPSENSTYSENQPSKTTIAKPHFYLKPNAHMTSHQNDRKIVLDFDRILTVFYAPSEETKTQSLAKGYLGKKTKRNVLKCKTKLIKVKIKKKKLGNDDNKDNYKRNNTDNNDTKENKKKYKMNNNNLYNIDNFISNTIKIVEKKEFFHIECPKFKEIPEDIKDAFSNNEMLIDQENNSINNNNNEFDEEEDISDEIYLKIHYEREQNEIDKRMNAYGEVREKKKKNNSGDKEKEMKQVTYAQSESNIEKKFIIHKDA